MSTLELEGICFRHDPASPRILEELSLSLEGGESALIIGDNGSGKSTLGKLIAGLNVQEKGSVLIDHRDVQSIATTERPKHVVYMGQTSYLQFFRSSIAEEIQFASRRAGRAAVSDVTYSQFRLPEDRRVKPMDLPYPAMWRLQLFLFSMVYSPKVLFIDEIVAPGARTQIDALDVVMAERERNGQVTILAYQRALPSIASKHIRTYDLLRGQLRERRQA